MNDASSPRTLKPELHPWFDAWKTSTENVLAQVLGQRHDFVLSAEPLAAADSDLRYTIVAAGAIQGEMALRLPQLSGIRLARMFVGGAEAAPGAQAITNDEREALEELLRQIAGLAATAVATLAGGEARFQLSGGEAPWFGTSDAMAVYGMREPSGAELAIEIRMSPALAAALPTRTAAATAASAEAPPPSSVSTATAVVASSEATINHATPPLEPHAAGYRRLFDVGLGVKLRFGTRRMLLRDVLALSSGLVVELDDELNSPVDLLLDGRIIARGEVVVIDGKYGLRVTAVVDPQPSGAPPA